MKKDTNSAETTPTQQATEGKATETAPIQQQQEQTQQDLPQLQEIVAESFAEKVNAGNGNLTANVITEEEGEQIRKGEGDVDYLAKKKPFGKNNPYNNSKKATLQQRNEIYETIKNKNYTFAGTDVITLNSDNHQFIYLIDHSAHTDLESNRTNGDGFGIREKYKISQLTENDIREITRNIASDYGHSETRIREVLQNLGIRPEQLPGVDITSAIKGGIRDYTEMDAQTGGIGEQTNSYGSSIDSERNQGLLSENQRESGVDYLHTFNGDIQKEDVRIANIQEAEQYLLSKYPEGSSNYKLTQFVFGALKQLPVNFVAKDLGEDISGMYSPSENTVYYNPNTIQENTILHECIHAVTIYYLKAKNKEGFSKDVQIAIQEIEECYNLLEQDYIEQHFSEKEKSNKDYIERAFQSDIFWDQTLYGYTSSEEMIAELSNPAFIEHIKDFDRRHKGKNIFQRLIDAIFKLFNINKSYSSLEGTVKKALVTLLQNPSKELRDRHAKENKTLKDNYKKWDKADHPLRIYEEKKFDEILDAIPDDFDGDFYDFNIAFPRDKVLSGYLIEDSGVTIILSQLKQGTKTVFRHEFYTILRSPLIKTENEFIFPIRLYSPKFLSTNTFDIVRDENGFDVVTNIQPIDAQLKINSPYINTELTDTEKDNIRKEVAKINQAKRSLINTKNALYLLDHTDREGLENRGNRDGFGVVAKVNTEGLTQEEINEIKNEYKQIEGTSGRLNDWAKRSKYANRFSNSDNIDAQDRESNANNVGLDVETQQGESGRGQSYQDSQVNSGTGQVRTGFDGTNGPRYTDKVDYLRTPDGEVYGFTKGNKMYLYKDKFNLEAGVHEYTHLWAKAVQDKNPELWQSIKEVLANDEVAQAVAKELKDKNAFFIKKRFFEKSKSTSMAFL